MPSDIPPPWDIYAQELFHHRHGYPLWAPNPARAQWDVEIADVGWLNEGTFLHLFRTTLPDGAEHQPHELLPEDYVPFVPRESTLFRSPESITQPVLYSRTIKNVSVSGGGSMNAPPLGGSASGNIGFQCAEDRGALLLLSPNGSATYMPSRRKVTQYMREYLDKWLLLANDTLDLPLNEQDIYFVTGVTKTSRWGVAAFYGSQRGVHGSVSCDFAALGSANIEVSISRLSAPGIWHKTGPPHARRRSNASPLLASMPTEPRYSHDSTSPPSIFGTESSTPLSPSSAAGPDLPTWASSAYSAGSSSSVPALAVPQASPNTPDKPNQCIFFHYYKAKRRRTKFFLRRFEARAGPHELPPPDPDDSYGSSDVLEEDSGGDSDSETVSGISKPYDPVNAALDYILENSEAEIAIASDMDLYALFQDQDFPVDVAEQLAQLKPHVDIDENYVGTFDVDMTFNREQVGEQSDEAPNVQRAISVSNAPPGPDIPDSPHDSDTPPLESPTSGGQTVSPRRKPPVNPRNELASHAGAIGNPTTHFGSITTLAYSADGKYLASGAEDTCITVRNVRDDTVVRHFTAHEDTVSALAFSPTCTLLASASSIGPIKLWDVEALHRVPQTIDVGNKAIRSLAFTPDGSKLLGGARDGTFSIWDAVSFELLATAQYDGEVTFIIFSADGRMMATGGTERVCRVWEVANLDIGAPKSVLAGHQSTVSSASFSSDGRYIVTGSCDFGCCIWSTEDGRALVELREHTGPVWSVCFSPDGTRVVSGSSDSTVKVWDARTGERVLSLEAHDGGVNAVAYSPDGTYVASASSDDTVRLWKFTQDGTLVKTYNEHDDFVTSMQFSPDSKTIASGSHDGTVYVRPL